MIKTCTILIPAWNCAKYIMECVESIKNQQPLKGWSYNLQIAVDACPETAGVLQREKIPFYWSPKNVGPYVLRNSLMELHPSDAYAYFDADDVMLPEYLKTVLFFASENYLIVPKKWQCDENMKRGKVVAEQGGAMLFGNGILKRLGGFQSERCAADTDFMERAKLSGFGVGNTSHPLYLRRRHDTSITRSGVNRYGSTARKQAWDRMTAARDSGQIYVKPVTTEFTQPPDFTKVKPKKKVVRRIFL